MLKLGNGTKLLLTLGLVVLTVTAVRASRRQEDGLDGEHESQATPTFAPQLDPEREDEGTASRRGWRRWLAIPINSEVVGNSMKKRILIGAVAAAAAFASVFGAAASLSMSADSLGAANAAVSACDPNGVSTAYTSAWDATDDRYEISSVTVNGIADACDGKSVKISLTDGTDLLAGANGTGTATIVGGSADNRSLAISLGTPAAASSVAGLHVIIG